MKPLKHLSDMGLEVEDTKSDPTIEISIDITPDEAPLTAEEGSEKIVKLFKEQNATHAINIVSSLLQADDITEVAYDTAPEVFMQILDILSNIDQEELNNKALFHAILEHTADELRPFAMQQLGKLAAQAAPKGENISKTPEATLFKILNEDSPNKSDFKHIYLGITSLISSPLAANDTYEWLFHNLFGHQQAVRIRKRSEEHGILYTPAKSGYSSDVKHKPITPTEIDTPTPVAANATSSGDSAIIDLNGRVIHVPQSTQQSSQRLELALGAVKTSLATAKKHLQTNNHRSAQEAALQGLRIIDNTIQNHAKTVDQEAQLKQLEQQLKALLDQKEEKSHFNSWKKHIGRISAAIGLAAIAVLGADTANDYIHPEKAPITTPNKSTSKTPPTNNPKIHNNNEMVFTEAETQPDDFDPTWQIEKEVKQRVAEINQKESKIPTHFTLTSKGFWRSFQEKAGITGRDFQILLRTKRNLDNKPGNAGYQNMEKAFEKANGQQISQLTIGSKVIIPVSVQQDLQDLTNNTLQLVNNVSRQEIERYLDSQKVEKITTTNESDEFDPEWNLDIEKLQQQADQQSPTKSVLGQSIEEINQSTANWTLEESQAKKPKGWFAKTTEFIKNFFKRA